MRSRLQADGPHPRTPSAAMMHAKLNDEVLVPEIGKVGFVDGLQHASGGRTVASVVSRDQSWRWSGPASQLSVIPKNKAPVRVTTADLSLLREAVAEIRTLSAVVGSAGTTRRKLPDEMVSLADRVADALRAQP